MTTSKLLILVSAGGLAWSAMAEDGAYLDQRWRFKFDIGGTFPENAELTGLDGPVTGGTELKLSPGLQFDFAADYRITPWLAVEGELGFTFNEVDAIGNWSYPNSSLYQMLFMANLVVEYPHGRFVPFAGVGAGGVLSALTFGNYYYYDYGYYYQSGSAGSGTDFVPAIQAFGGVRYQFYDHWSAGLMYRFLATDNQEWNIDWWDGSSFRVGVDSICIQSVSFVVTGSF